MEEYIYEMINQYGVKGNEAIEMYQTLQKVSKNSNLSLEEAVKSVNNK